jgi:hypothetical protein
MYQDRDQSLVSVKLAARCQEELCCKISQKAWRRGITATEGMRLLSWKDQYRSLRYRGRHLLVREYRRDMDPVRGDLEARQWATGQQGAGLRWMRRCREGGVSCPCKEEVESTRVLLWMFWMLLVCSGRASMGRADTDTPSDPYVSTLTTINNVQNSLFVPNLGRWLNRRPTYDLPGRPEIQMREEKEAQDMLEIMDNSPENIRQGSYQETDQASLVPRRTVSRASITSQLSESHYAVLPHGVSIDDWSKEDRDLLNDHVRHLLHSRREKFRRQMRAFRNYVRKPLGLFVTVYAFLVTTFGLVWVLFLIGWISGGDRHEYDINVIDNVLVGLFALIGDVLGMSSMCYYVLSQINFNQHRSEL